MSMYEENQQQERSLLRGIIGALLGALLGAVIWGVVGLVTLRVFAILGLALGLLVAKGYELFKGPEGAAKVVTVALCVILSVTLGETIFTVGMLHQEYKNLPQYINEALAEEGIDVSSLSEEDLQVVYSMLPTEKDFITEALQDPEMREESISNLGQSLLFAVLGAGAYIYSLSRKNDQAPEAVTAPEAEQPEAEESGDDAA